MLFCTLFIPGLGPTCSLSLYRHRLSFSPHFLSRPGSLLLSGSDLIEASPAHLLAGGALRFVLEMLNVGFCLPVTLTALWGTADPPHSGTFSSVLSWSLHVAPGIG